VLVGSPGSVSNNTQKVKRLHTLFFKVTNVWKECEFIVKNNTKEFDLFPMPIRCKRKISERSTEMEDRKIAAQEIDFFFRFSLPF